MATLAKDSPRVFALGDMQDHPVIASDIIYAGAAVGDNGSGYSRPLQAGDAFKGFATEKADNSSGAAGDIRVRTKERGNAELSIGGLAITDVGKPVYASDDDTFTLTAGSNTCIGHVSQFVSSGVGIVAFRATKSVEAVLTDNSGGTAGATIAAIGASYSQSEVQDAVASLAAKVNYLLQRLGA